MTNRSKRTFRLTDLILWSLGFAALGMFSPPVQAQGADDEQRPCVEMLESWYGVDVDKLRGHLHPNFIKQGVYYHPKTGELKIARRNREEFLGDVGADRPKMPEEQWNIEAETLDLSDLLATVKVTSVHLVDVCQMAKIDGKWQIMNVLWTLRDAE